MTTEVAPVGATEAHDILTLQNTRVREVCQRCGVMAEAWKPRYGLSLRRGCLDCWKAYANGQPPPQRGAQP